MAKEKVYLETSVISYLTARPSRDAVKRARQELTQLWWKESRSIYEFYVSDLVLEEIQSGDPEAARQRVDFAAALPMLPTTIAVRGFHERFFAAKILPEKARADAMHIAIAAAHGMTYLATWNCAHISNDALKGKILDEIRSAGYTEVIMATPEELWRRAQ